MGLCKPLVSARPMAHAQITGLFVILTFNGNEEMKQKGILITLAASLLLVGSAAIARAEVKDTDFKAAMDKYLQTEEGQKSLGEAFKA